MRNKPIVIKRVLLKNYKELRNIAGNKGIGFQLFMSQSLTAIANKYPDNLKKELTEKEKKEALFLYGVSEKTQKEIFNICENLGVTDLSTFLKIELKSIADSHPEKMKQKPLDY
jgi:hypothetical protein